MEHINKIELAGIIGTTRKILDGKALRFSLVTNRVYKDKDSNFVIESTWHDCTAFAGKKIPEETLEKLDKGTAVHLTGRLRQERYTDESGQTRYITTVLASELEIVNS